MPLTDAEHALLQRAATLSRDIVSPNAARWERERRIGHEGLARIFHPVARCSIFEHLGSPTISSRVHNGP